MITRRSYRVATGVALTFVTGGLVVGLAGSATAQLPEPGAGVASMSSPYIPDVPHVPSNTILALGPGGSADGARFIGPSGSLFNGTFEEVAARVNAWWAEQMAAGVSPEEADEMLANPAK